jgi:hypothetical protein
VQYDADLELCEHFAPSRVIGPDRDFPVSSARIRRATSRMISAPTGSSAT